MEYSKRNPSDGFGGRQPDSQRPALDAPYGARSLGATGDRPVQLDRGGTARADDPAAIEDAAAHGTSGAAGTLPHLDTIQQAFGHHDVRGVEAHVGGAASEGAAAMGAEAFATGNHVAFAGTPGLHTAAHEAAHVVQQRAGVHLKGGLGAAGDVYEQHADAAADAVVAGRSAQPVLDQLAGGPTGSWQGAAAPVQRKLIADDKTTMTKVSDLGLASDKSPSREVVALLDDPKSYYLPPAPNFEASSLNVLEEKKYILGESHGDGTWAARTQGWGHIQKMLEGLKGFQAEDSTHGSALSDKGQSVRGVAEQAQGSEALPLEDRHAYTMTRMLMQQQMLNDYDNLKQVSDGQDLIHGGLEEIACMMLSYAQVGLAWCQRLGERPTGRGAHFLAVGLDHLQSPAHKLINEVATKKRGPASLSAQEVTTIQTALKACIDALIELLDTRPMGGGFLGMFQSKQGADPITNRSQLGELSAVGGSGTSAIEALNAGNVVREQAMIANIKKAPGPLLVQIGTAHVDNVVDGVGGDAVPVKKGDDFDALTRKP